MGGCELCTLIHLMIGKILIGATFQNVTIGRDMYQANSKTSGDTSQKNKNKCLLDLFKSEQMRKNGNNKMNEFLEIVETLEHANANRSLNKATVEKMKIAWFILKDIQNSLPRGSIQIRRE